MAIQYGMSEQSAAARATIARVLGGRASGGARRTRRKVKAKTKRAVKRRVKKAARRVGGSKFTKGSSAAKAHMARLRKMVSKRKR